MIWWCSRRKSPEGTNDFPFYCNPFTIHHTDQQIQGFTVRPPGNQLHCRSDSHTVLQQRQFQPKRLNSACIPALKTAFLGTVEAGSEQEHGPADEDTWILLQAQMQPVFSHLKVPQEPDPVQNLHSAILLPEASDPKANLGILCLVPHWSIKMGFEVANMLDFLLGPTFISMPGLQMF